jgi:hypothetical protein
MAASGARSAGAAGLNSTEDRLLDWICRDLNWDSKILTVLVF